jgi:hypothetical protein
MTVESARTVEGDPGSGGAFAAGGECVSDWKGARADNLVYFCHASPVADGTARRSECMEKVCHRQEKRDGPATPS